MKLDSRILEGKKPLDCFDVDIAKQFIGHEGYFCDHRSGFTNIYNLVKDVLRDITPDDNYCEVYKTNCTSWEYFLPEEWIKEPEEKPEKKYRPFKDHAEYKEYLNDGIIESWIQIREKPTGEVSELMYVGGSEAIICLGAYAFDLNDLFYDFELFNESTGEWQPFGIEE